MFTCIDCGINTKDIEEYYMVKDHIWESYGSRNGMLCIGCLEKRMSRQLNPDDFSDCPLNHSDLWKKSSRLLNRLGYYEYNRSLL